MPRTTPPTHKDWGLGSERSSTSASSSSSSSSTATTTTATNRSRTNTAGHPTNRCPPSPHPLSYSCYFFLQTGPPASEASSSQAASGRAERARREDQETREKLGGFGGLGINSEVVFSSLPAAATAGGSRSQRRSAPQPATGILSLPSPYY